MEILKMEGKDIMQSSPVFNGFGQEEAIDE